VSRLFSFFCEKRTDDADRGMASPLFEIALVLVPFDQVTSRTVNANQGIM
jgi:hypothetical protein